MQILIAHPSPVMSARLRTALTNHPKVLGCQTATSLTDTYHIAEHQRPDAVILDAELAQCAEFELLSSLFRIMGIGCVLFHDETTHFPILPGHDKPHIAHHNGAINAEQLIDLIPKPSARQWHGVRPASPKENERLFDPKRLILIGASTGGVDALIKTVCHFDTSTPPVMIVQHTGGSFAQSLIRLLDGATQARVMQADDGMSLRQGQIYLAPGDTDHLCLAGRQAPRIALSQDDLVSGHRPSVDALFLSAVPFAPHVSAALLTGMGRDGAAGMVALHKAGAHTIAQDQKTSVVFGMPRVAIESGGVAEVLPISEIGPALLRASQVKVQS